MLGIIKNFLKEHMYAASLYSRQIAGTIVLFVIARYLSVYDYGLFTSYKSIAAFCLMFANMEFSNYILVSSQAKIKEVQLKVSFFLLNAISVVILISLFSLSFKLDSHLLFILVVIRTFFDSVFFGLILSFFQASRKYNVIAKINIFYSAFIMLIALVSFILKLSLVKFLLLNILLGLANFIQCSYYIQTKYLLIMKYYKRLFSRLDRSILGYIGSTITEYLYTQLASLYVAICLTKQEAALYFAAVVIASVPGLLSAAQTQKIMPDLMNPDNIERRKVLNYNIKFICSILLAALAGIIILGKPILKLLYGNPYYMGAYPILIIYFTATIFTAIGAVHGAHITAMGYQNKKVQLKIETTLITAISLLILHKYGLCGAVVSFLLSAIYVSIRYSCFSYNLFKKGQ